MSLTRVWVASIVSILAMVAPGLLCLALALHVDSLVAPLVVVGVLSVGVMVVVEALLARRAWALGLWVLGLRGTEPGDADDLWSTFLAPVAIPLVALVGRDRDSRAVVVPGLRTPVARVVRLLVLLVVLAAPVLAVLAVLGG